MKHDVKTAMLLRLVVVLVGASLAGACSSPADEMDVAEETQWFIPTKDIVKDKQSRPGDAGDVDMFQSDTPLQDMPDNIDDFDVETTLVDVVGDVPDDGLQTPETVEPDVFDPLPTEYPFDTVGPMTISMKGIIIGGQYVQMRFAEVSYWKVPYDQWDYLLDMVKEAGFNGVYTSACWARHEVVKGQADFTTGNLNAAEFLEKLQARGLYAYFAAGPWLDGEAGGCLPPWLLAGGNGTPSSMADGIMAVRMGDADYQSAVAAYFDQLNAVVSMYQLTSFPQGPIVFYQIESNYDAFYFLTDAAGRVMQDLLGSMPPQLNMGLYFGQLRDTVKADGISVPLVTALTGDFENGGRRVLGTGDTPGIYPAFDMNTDSRYLPMELKLWVMRKEMRKNTLHGQVYMMVPGIAVNLVPSPAQMARALMAGADVVVVRDFAASALPGQFATVSPDADGIGILAGINDLRVGFGSNVRDPASPLTLSGVPRQSYFGFKQLNQFMALFAPSFSGKDLPNRSGPNKYAPVYNLKLTEPSVGSIEDFYKWDEGGVAGGITEILGDGFEEWYQFPQEAIGRATYYYDSADGTIIAHLVGLDRKKDGENLHEPQDFITKIKFNGEKIPRHSNIVVPVGENPAEEQPGLGWGSKFVVLNHPLGPGYPILEYASSSILTIRDFNNRRLIVMHGKPVVKSNGAYFTEPGEISLAGFGGIPDISHNSLPGGAIYTDPGGKMAIQFQHDDTGYMTAVLPGGKQLMLLASTMKMAQTLHFAKDAMGQDLAILGMDRVESVQPTPEGLIITGQARPNRDKFIVLTNKKPFKVVANGDSADCQFDEQVGVLECTYAASGLPPETVAHTEMYVRDEMYLGSPADVGITEFPDQFAAVNFSPVALEDPAVGAYHGIAWYVAEFQGGAVPPNLEGFFSLAGGAGDVVSLFVNGSYVGTSVSVGNAPMSAADVAAGLPSAGFRIPPGIVVQGTNVVALRVVALGHSRVNMPMLYASAPILPPELDQFASAIPHFAVEGLAATSRKGVWGQAKVTVGAASVPVSGPWSITKGDGQGMARTYGMMKGWHQIDPNPASPTNHGFVWVADVNEQVPVDLADGQLTWLTTTFSSDDLDYRGTIELGLEGRSAIGLVFLNGHWIGTWLSDEQALSQGLHSKLLQGAGTRQLLANIDYQRPYSGDSDRIPLPPHLISQSGGHDNRVTCLLIDISPPLDFDLMLPSLGTLTGKGTLTDFTLYWSREDPLTENPGEEGVAVWGAAQFELLDEPPPPQE